MVKNDGVSAVHRITLDDIVDAKKKVIVPEKTMITPELAKNLQKNYKHDAIEVR